MIYLSRIELNSENPQRRRLLADCYELHRSIMSAFPDRADSVFRACARDEERGGSDLCGGARRRFNVLFRLNDTGSPVELIVQSDIEPDWEKSIFAPCFPGETCCLKETGEIIENAVENGKFFSFHLRACPSKRLMGNGQKGKRVLLSGRDDQLDWFVRKGSQHGFDVVPESLTLASPQSKVGRNKGIFFQSVDYSGRLMVTDKKVFVHALAGGIGAEKAFGCGLLMISR